MKKIYNNADFLEQALATKEYDFLRTHQHLGKNIMFLTLGGSRAYGTSVESSDVDVRGVMLNSRESLIGMTGIEHVNDSATDTSIYAFNKFVSLISNCNPNTIELLGCREYTCVSPLGQELLDNKEMFLSQRASASFGGYAVA